MPNFSISPSIKLSIDVFVFSSFAFDLSNLKKRRNNRIVFVYVTFHKRTTISYTVVLIKTVTANTRGWHYSVVFNGDGIQIRCNVNVYLVYYSLIFCHNWKTTCAKLLRTNLCIGSIDQFDIAILEWQKYDQSIICYSESEWPIWQTESIVVIIVSYSNKFLKKSKKNQNTYTQNRNECHKFSSLLLDCVIDFVLLGTFS